MRTLIVGTLVVAASASAALAQDVNPGETSFKKCVLCHSVGADARNKIGPILNGLDGRKAGTVEGFDYSDALKNAAITWTEATFNNYIADPSANIPGTKMAFAGLKSEKEVADLWAYLKQFSPDGKR